MSDFEFSFAALQNIKETDADYQEDCRKIQGGRLTRESLLLACLDGADADRTEGWRDYVNEVCRVAADGRV